MMHFHGYVRWFTGLSLYDFRVLDLDDTSEKEVRDLFRAWVEEYNPTASMVAEAIEAAAREGFDVRMA